jgi:hypothetical protein
MCVAVGIAVLSPVANVAAMVVIDDDFATGPRGWTAGFADYPPAADLVADHRARPAHLGGADSWYISGRNFSDDLFMYFKKQVSGLQPNATYDVQFEIEFATQAPDGSFGIGGSPANSVIFKAGATVVEPKSVLEKGMYRMNIDKGNQQSEGADTDNLGDIAKPDDGNWNFVMVSRDNLAQPFPVTTDANGRVWLIFGTDSGFEGTTSLYYTRYRATFVPEPGSLLVLTFLSGVALRRRPGRVRAA